MAAHRDSVCKFICNESGWSASNLQLQKILYLGQMIYMGRNNGQRLFEGNFEAWDYGPVEPLVYRKVRMFGSGAINDVFFDARRFATDDERGDYLNEVCHALLPKKAGELVEITHWKDGAWARNYAPGARGIRIPDREIAREYADRIAVGNLKDNQHSDRF